MATLSQETEWKVVQRVSKAVYFWQMGPWEEDIARLVLGQIRPLDRDALLRKYSEETVVRKIRNLRNRWQNKLFEPLKSKAREFLNSRDGRLYYQRICLWRGYNKSRPNEILPSDPPMPNLPEDSEFVKSAKDPAFMGQVFAVCLDGGMSPTRCIKYIHDLARDPPRDVQVYTRGWGEILKFRGYELLQLEILLQALDIRQYRQGNMVVVYGDCRRDLFKAAPAIGIGRPGQRAQKPVKIFEAKVNALDRTVKRRIKQASDTGRLLPADYYESALVDPSVGHRAILPRSI